MEKKKIVVVMCILLVMTVNALATLTLHIGGAAGGTIYVKRNGAIPGHAAHTPDNSVLHESWDLITPGSPNYLGYYAKFIFYDGIMHVDPTGKVGWTDTIWVGCNAAGGYGILEVEGVLTGDGGSGNNLLRPWKGGVTMDVNMISGLLKGKMLNVGISDTGNNRGIVNLRGGTVQFNDVNIYNATGCDSYVDITGGELLILNANKSVVDMQTWITAGDIFNSLGTGLLVTTKTVDGALYTSVAVPEPATVMLLSICGLVMLRKKK
ncbi:MAG: PEP-CTERM sorting domain-containing protein [Phycisphaerae bacterium]|nr:PEP-CTERM sorting domain-containing protein [Phycisphaerae bacterium]